MSEQEVYRAKRDQRDKRIIEWMKEDFEGGFARLYEVYRKQLYRVAFNILEGTGLAYMAEDVVQDSIIKAYSKLKWSYTKDPRAFEKMKMRAWLYTITRHQAISLLRAGDKTVELEEEQILEGEIWDVEPSYMKTIRISGPEDQHERRETIAETKQLISRTLAKLNETERQVLQRKYLTERKDELEEVTLKQVAREMGVPLGTVKSAISRGSLKLRKLVLDEWEMEGIKSF